MNTKEYPNNADKRPSSARPHKRNAAGTPISYDAPQAPSANQIADAARRRAIEEGKRLRRRAGEVKTSVAQHEAPAHTAAPSAEAAHARLGQTSSARAAKGATRDFRKSMNGGGYAPGASRLYSAGPRPPRGPRVPAVALGVVAFFAVAIGLGWAYLTMWRSVPITVNGEPVEMRVNSTVAAVLEENAYFDATPGRLMSVSDKVLDEDGGERCTVELGRGDRAKKIAAGEFDTFKLEEGAQLTVGDGSDVTEEYGEESTVIAPKLKMEQGGAIQYVRQWGKNGKKAVWTGKVSGETVDKGVIVEPEDMVIASRNVSPKGEKGKKYIALTFDDGPSQYTQKILDILTKKGAHATFYNLGKNSAAYPELSRKVIESGCELASHTNAHENLPTLGRDALRSEITLAFDSLEEASGERLQMIRAPYGAFTAQEWLRAYDLISCNVLWNIDTLDWKLPGADAIKNMVVSQAYNGAIVLMHDGGGDRSQDIAALPGMIDALQADGYEILTVSELMALDDSFPEEVVKGAVKVPKGAVIPK